MKHVTNRKVRPNTTILGAKKLNEAIWGSKPIIRVCMCASSFIRLLHYNEISVCRSYLSGLWIIRDRIGQEKEKVTLFVQAVFRCFIVLCLLNTFYSEKYVLLATYYSRKRHLTATLPSSQFLVLDRENLGAESDFEKTLILAFAGSFPKRKCFNF